MSDAVATPTTPGSPTAPPLGRIATGGFVWSFGFTILSKLAGVAGQIILARLLIPEDYGAVSLAYTTAILPNVIRDAGTIQILVQRRHQFAELANAAFWMSFCLGLLAGILIAISAPIAAHIYSSPQVLHLSLILAICSPINSLTIVPGAKMQIDLRLRLLAGIGAATPILTTALSIFFAWLGWGAFGLVLPILIVAMIRLPFFWAMSPYPLKWKLDVGRWRPFLVDGSLLLGTSLCWAVVAQGDYAILGLFTSKEKVGYYFFAFSLSMQTVQLLSGSLSGVLFPTLSRLKDEPNRQRAAFIRASRLSAAITIPLALLPVACARPLITFLFGDKWLPATALLQILSIAAAMATLGTPIGSYLMAQGRNRTAFFYALSMSLYFVCSITIGTWLFAETGTASFVSCFHIVGVIAGYYLTLSPGGNATGPILRITAIPVLLGTIAVTVSAWVTSRSSGIFPRDWMQVGISLIVLIGVYFPLLAIFSRDTVDEVWERARGIFHGRKRTKFSAPRGMAVDENQK